MIKDVFVSFITNRMLIAVFFAWLVSQIIKVLAGLIKHKKLNPKLLIALGGMPSSHSSTVSALATAVLLVEGVSTTFVISLVLAFIVIRDALGVRREVQKHARVLRKISNEKVLEDVGHTFPQVLAGIVIGIILALIII